MNILISESEKPLIKVLFITSKLQHYRIPILNIIAQTSKIDLTVAHSGKMLEQANFLFKEITFKEKTIGPFTIHEKKMQEYCNSFDVVVSMFYLQKISLMKLLLKRNRNYKLIYWGIGVKASQKSRYDSPSILNHIRYYIAKKSDAMIFYTEYAAKKYISKGINKDKIFIMNNTVQVFETQNNNEIKNRLLLVGTLNKSKKVFDLLEAYLEAYKINSNVPILDIIGGGIDYEGAKNWVNKNNLNQKIIFYGPIYDEIAIMTFFKKALASISPGQAGLSVLTSFGYGVPFITQKDAITGGERLSIENNYNGILYENKKDLKQIILDITNNPQTFIKMGENAQYYYNKERTPSIMAQGFIDAVNYVIKNKN